MNGSRFRILVLALLLLIGVVYALAAFRFQLFPYAAAPKPPKAVGERSVAPEGQSAAGAPSSLDEAELERLRALGYLPGYDRVRDEPSGVVHRTSEKVQPGLNLYMSAHAPEAILMTPDGERLHNWRHRFTDACPDEDPEGVDSFLHRARALPNGDLLAIFDYDALIRLDRESRLIWAQCRSYHHDFTLAEDGAIHAVRSQRSLVRHGKRRRLILDEMLEILSPSGKVLESVSLYGAFADSEYASMITFSSDAPVNRPGDIFHVNAVKWLDGRHERRFPAAKRGNVLISIRHMSMLAIVDLKRERVVWVLQGSWRFQHEPVLLDNGHILLFDNYGLGEHSRVIELDPQTGEIIWQYAGDGQENFFSPTLGSNERLPNGNTLINLSARGRVLEVTPDHELVWEFRSPHSVQDGELIATLQYLTRLRPDFPVDWLAD